MISDREWPLTGESRDVGNPSQLTIIGGFAKIFDLRANPVVSLGYDPRPPFFFGGFHGFDGWMRYP
jgi:hypothetical protein